MGSLSSLFLDFLEQPREIDSAKFEGWRYMHSVVAEVVVISRRGGKELAKCVQGASFHMIGNKKIFSHLKEKDMHIHIELGDDGQYETRGVGTGIFQKELGNPLHLIDIQYVLGLTQNLVSVATFEDKGYDVIFKRDKVYLQHLASRCKKKISVRVKNIYKL